VDKSRRQVVLTIKAYVPYNTNRKKKPNSIKYIQNLPICYETQPALERRKIPGKNCHIINFVRTGDGPWGHFDQ